MGKVSEFLSQFKSDNFSDLGAREAEVIGLSIIGCAVFYDVFGNIFSVITGLILGAALIGKLDLNLNKDKGK